MPNSSSNDLNLLEAEFREMTAASPFPLQYPPNCLRAMKTEFVVYESRKKLVLRFPVLEEYLNPMRTMQGGFITAAFDNTFGPLSYLVARSACTTLNIETQFIRSAGEGETLTVTALVVSRGTQTIYMSGEAVNSKGKLVATASTNLLILKG